MLNQRASERQQWTHATGGVTHTLDFGWQNFRSLTKQAAKAQNIQYTLASSSVHRLAATKLKAAARSLGCRSRKLREKSVRFQEHIAFVEPTSLAFAYKLTLQLLWLRLVLATPTVGTNLQINSLNMFSLSVVSTGLRWKKRILLLAICEGKHAPSGSASGVGQV